MIKIQFPSSGPDIHPQIQAEDRLNVEMAQCLYKDAQIDVRTCEAALSKGQVVVPIYGTHDIDDIGGVFSVDIEIFL